MIWGGWLIDAIQFSTTSGRLSRKYGGEGGSRFAYFGNGRPLMAFKGRCAEALDWLEVCIAITVPDLPVC